MGWRRVGGPRVQLKDAHGPVRAGGAGVKGFTPRRRRSCRECGWGSRDVNVCFVSSDSSLSVIYQLLHVSAAKKILVSDGLGSFVERVCVRVPFFSRGGQAQNGFQSFSLPPNREHWFILCRSCWLRPQVSRSLSRRSRSATRWGASVWRRREKGALREELRKEFSDRGLLGSGRGSQGIVLNKL